MSKKIKVRVKDLYTYVTFCDAGTLYSHDVWWARCRLMAALVKSDKVDVEVYWNEGDK